MMALLGATLFMAVPTKSRMSAAIPLNSVTFDRVVDGTRPVLVKFDKEHAYGGALNFSSLPLRLFAYQHETSSKAFHRCFFSIFSGAC